ncbi:hypothetical protein ACFQLX_24620 [Streptomyces polyrhachis]|uniref:Uncharacterized protein n=1 Tax=Streptomyces polyrhachis TaxID=1282885 RepID=A0ABW2GMV7_9ACTN
MTRLTAAGFTPRREERGEYIALVTQVPRPLSAEAWQQLYELLATADRWGLESRKGGLTADASVRKDPRDKQRQPGAEPSTAGEKQ